MTREEAMYLLNNLRSVAEGEEDEAIDIAIEALSAMDTLVDAFIEDGEELAESVKVVRCKDCRHYLINGFTATTGWCCEIKTSVYEGDYCSYGERIGGYGERSEE